MFVILLQVIVINCKITLTCNCKITSKILSIEFFAYFYVYDWLNQRLSPHTKIHTQNNEDTRKFLFLHNAIASKDNNCTTQELFYRRSSGWRDRPFLDRTHLVWEGSRQHTPTKIASALESFPATCWTLGQIEASSNF